MYRKKNRQKPIEDTVDVLNGPLKDMKMSRSLDENIALVKQLFEGVDTMKFKEIQNNKDPSLRFFLFFCDGMVNSLLINENIIKPLMLTCALEPGANLLNTAVNRVVQINESQITDEIGAVITSVCYGDTVLLVEGCGKAAIFGTKGFDVRAIGEPDSEKNLSGPREGFTESLLTNLAMLRRKARTNDLKSRLITMGRRTQTCVCICYIDGIVNQGILEETYRRLGKIDLDGFLDSNYITELIRDERWSPFRTIGYTERPDVVVGKLLEGRIAILVDGSPVALTIPYLFIENFQSGEDYYLNFFYTSFARLLRIIGFFISIVVPALYVAIVAFHREILPTPLFISILSERQTTPLPIALEAFIMLLVFDMLRETGVRMPSNVGQALSIVGALVIGQAAVTANLVSAPMIIVVATSGITNLLVPKLNAPVTYLRFLLLLLASAFGLYGLILGIAQILIHMLNLQSFGIAALPFNGSLNGQRNKDTVFRAPWWRMITRPRKIAENLIRQRGGGYDG